MKGREILGRAVEVVAFLFAMFSGFLENVAPPEDVAEFAVGFASFLALILLLFVSVQARGRFSARRRKIWMAMAGVLAVGALITGLVYQRHLGTLTYDYPPDDLKPERLIRGTRYTPEAQAIANQGRSPGQVLAQFGPDNLHRVWPPETIENARTILTVEYLILVLALAGTIFSLVEVYLAGEKAAPAEPAHPPAQAGSRALAHWQEKLDFLKEQEAIVADPAQKYTLKKQIEEAEERIRELTPIELA